MTLLTFFPPTFATSKGSTNGSNGMFFAHYWRDHPFAAAIAAQEVREARMKLPYTLGGAVAGALIAFAFGFPPAAYILAVMAGILPMAILCRRNSFRRKLELKGQAVECVVRRDRYGCSETAAIFDSAAQISRYGQFDGMSMVEIVPLLTAEIPSAEKWASNNHSLIERALKIQEA